MVLLAAGYQLVSFQESRAIADAQDHLLLRGSASHCVLSRSCTIISDSASTRSLSSPCLIRIADCSCRRRRWMTKRAQRLSKCV